MVYLFECDHRVNEIWDKMWNIVICNALIRNSQTNTDKNYGYSHPIYAVNNGINNRNKNKIFFISFVL